MMYIKQDRETEGRRSALKYKETQGGTKDEGAG